MSETGANKSAASAAAELAGSKSTRAAAAIDAATTETEAVRRDLEADLRALREDVARLKLERLLRGFVEDVRKAAKQARLDDDDLAAAEALLDETRDRLKNEIFRADEP